MSDNFETARPSGSGTHTTGSSGTVDAAKQEAADLKDTAATEAKDVVDTAKDEAASVLRETKTQARDLVAQTQRELKEQAGTQQQRVAGGLRSVSQDLGAMASKSEGDSMAGDLVQQASDRLSAASTWLGDRDPSAVLAEVKRYARRKPGMFILAAAVVGVVVGRLTRALATNAADEKEAAQEHTTPTAPVRPAASVPPLVSPDPLAPAAGTATAGLGAPVYTQPGSPRPDVLGEGGYDRPEAV